MSNPTSPVRIGVAGWSFPHWDGLVYPVPRPKSFHPLEFLATIFDALEVNTTFYQPPRQEVSKLWVHKVSHNPDFRFTVKLHQRFTHERVLLEDEVRLFTDGLRPLRESGRLGCLLMQFPWSFRFTEENRDYLIRLRRAFHTFPLAVEMRHASWSCEEALGTFIDYHLGFANIDQPAHVKAMPPTAFLTSPCGYARMHGRDKQHWMEEYSKPGSAGRSYDYLYSVAELDEWRTRIQRVHSFAAETYVIFNNDARAQSVVNALQMRAMMEGRRLVSPGKLHLTYWDELYDFIERPKQEMLFEMPAPAMASSAPPVRAVA